MYLARPVSCIFYWVGVLKKWMPSLAGQARKDGENSIPAASQMAFTAFAAPSFVANELPVNENYERKKELKKLGTVKSEVISEYM